jgi:hypothetical protein
MKSQRRTFGQLNTSGAREPWAEGFTWNQKSLIPQKLILLRICPHSGSDRKNPSRPPPIGFLVFMCFHSANLPAARMYFDAMPARVRNTRLAPFA